MCPSAAGETPILSLLCETAFKAGGVYLVTMPVDYSENKRVLVDEVRARVPAPTNA